MFSLLRMLTRRSSSKKNTVSLVIKPTYIHHLFLYQNLFLTESKERFTQPYTCWYVCYIFLFKSWNLPTNYVTRRRYSVSDLIFDSFLIGKMIRFLLLLKVKKSTQKINFFPSTIACYHCSFGQFYTLWSCKLVKINNFVLQK